MEIAGENGNLPSPLADWPHSCVFFRGHLRWSAMVCDASRTPKSQENDPFHRSVWPGLNLLGESNIFCRIEESALQFILKWRLALQCVMMPRIGLLLQPLPIRRMYTCIPTSSKGFNHYVRFTSWSWTEWMWKSIKSKYIMMSLEAVYSGGSHVVMTQIAILFVSHMAIYFPSKLLKG